MDQFKIYSQVLKAYEDEDGGKRFRTTASSTIQDLEGHEITESAIAMMADKAKQGLTIFLNHRKDVPEDVLGTVEDAHVVHRLGEDKFPVVDLDFDIRVNEANPRAIQTWETIKGGTRLGTSIGALVPADGFKKNNRGGVSISQLNLVEASIVGVPANPRTWVHYAMKSLNLDAIPVLGDETEKAACSCGHGADCSCDTCSCASHGPAMKTIEPDIELAVASDSKKPQEAPEADPETGLLDETADGDDEVLGDSVTKAAPETEETLPGEPSQDAEVIVPETDGTHVTMKSAEFTQVFKALKDATDQIIVLQKSLSAAEKERDEANENFAVAKQIIDRIADLPLGRKAHFYGGVEDFRKRFEGVYAPEFLEFLEK